jgi:hypothetical protein
MAESFQSFGPKHRQIEVAGALWLSMVSSDTSIKKSHAARVTSDPTGAEL